MRARRVRKRVPKPCCAICKDQTCIDDKPKIICTINSDMRYTSRMTRSMTKLLKELNGIVIYETYRCMPLLGGEKENAPDWDIHIVRYTIVFIRQTS